MWHDFVKRIGVTSVVGFTALTAGCDTSPPSPTSPGGPAKVEVLRIADVSPPRGLTGDVVRIGGTGFLPGVAVGFGGVPARVGSITNSAIMATVPFNIAGAADVVVTNHNGESATLVRGYIFEAVSLIGGPGRVTPGSTLTVRWTAPRGRPRWDWIGLFKYSAANTTYNDGWYDYTNGAPSGTFTVVAPSQPGEYEFRYLVDDGFEDAARSELITIQ
jgi:hypothetical protein